MAILCILVTVPTGGSTVTAWMFSVVVVVVVEVVERVLLSLNVRNNNDICIFNRLSPKNAL